MPHLNFVKERDCFGCADDESLDTLVLLTLCHIPFVIPSTMSLPVSLDTSPAYVSVTGKFDVEGQPSSYSVMFFLHFNCFPLLCFSLFSEPKASFPLL